MQAHINDCSILWWRHQNGTFSALLPPCVGNGHRWIPLKKASSAELWCFLWFVPGQIIEQAIETPVIWDAMELILTLLQESTDAKSLSGNEDRFRRFGEYALPVGL